MSIRKRVWKDAKGEEKTAWVADYVDQGGKRRLKTFVQKKKADTFHSTAKVEVKAGIHTADSSSITVAEAGERWITACPKSGSGERTVPLTPMVVTVLQEWKDECPKSKLDLVFPTPKGEVQGLSNIVKRGLVPAQINAGVIKEATGAYGVLLKRAKYPGLHALRHFYAS